jgi:hypothetical protein
MKKKKIQVQNFNYLQVIWMYKINIQIKFQMSRKQTKTKYKVNKKTNNKIKNKSLLVKYC